MRLVGFALGLFAALLATAPALADDQTPIPVLPVRPTPITELLLPAPGAWPPPPPKIWTGGVEFGVTGAEGNSENFKLRLGGGARRTTKDSVLKLDFLYSNATQNGVRSENRSIGNVRLERPFPFTKLSSFVSGQTETDEFKEYDLRLSGHTGIGYDIFKAPHGFLKGRLGSGGSREIGGRENRFVPEALFGLDAECKLTERQKVCASIEYFPDFGAWGDYRVQSKLAYEILVDPEWNLTLKFGVFDRYDSTPQGRVPNDLDYSAVLLWKF